jgi:hypothetical protein
MTMTETKDRIAALTKTLTEVETEATEMSNAWKDEEGKLVLSDEEAAKFQEKVAEGVSIKNTIVALESKAGIRDFLGREPGSAPAAGSDAAEMEREALSAATKGLGQRFLDSEAYSEMKASGFRLPLNYEFKSEGVSLYGGLDRKDVYSLSAGTVSIQALGRAQQLDLQERTLRPSRVRDLFPSEQTTAQMLYGIRETGFINAARPVPEREMDNTVVPAVEVFGRKPKSSVTLTTVTYPISTIAHTMDVHKNVLDDEPRLRGLLDRDMIDGVKMSEDDQILYGDGVGENMTGIVNTPGIQTYAQVAADKKSAAIRRAATRAMLAWFVPTGVVLHPFDWEDIELETDLNGAYTIATSVAIGGEKRVWRMQIIDTPAIVQDRFLLGAFGQGAKVYDREQVNVIVSTENRDNVERNVVTLRGEERVGLEVPRPESFVYGSFIAG